MKDNTDDFYEDMPLGFQVHAMAERVLRQKTATAASKALARAAMKLKCRTCKLPASECSDADGPKLS